MWVNHSYVTCITERCLSVHEMRVNCLTKSQLIDAYKCVFMMRVLHKLNAHFGQLGIVLKYKFWIVEKFKPTLKKISTKDFIFKINFKWDMTVLLHKAISHDSRFCGTCDWVHWNASFKMNEIHLTVFSY